MNRIIFFLLLSFVSVFSYSQTHSFNNERRAIYICEFIRQLTWPENATNLTVCVLEPEAHLCEEMRRYAVPENTGNRKLTVVSLKNLQNLPRLDLLYVNKDWNPKAPIDSLEAVAEANKFLFITEAASFNQSMINFVSLKDYTFYGINEPVLQKTGFTYISSSLQLGAIKSGEEWKTLFGKQELDLLKMDNTRLQNEIERRRDVMRTQREQLQTLNEDITAKQDQLKVSETKINEYLATLRMQNVIMILGALLLISFAIFGIYIYRNYREKNRINKLLEAQNMQILEQRDQLANQRDQIVEQNKEITDSIIAAHRIQRAILPKQKILENHVDMFIFYRPRDIVSGDFYWMSKKENKLVIVAADCTGHGVPGAFMSLLGIAFLNEIVNKENEVYANEILNKLRDSVVNSLNQQSSPNSEQEERANEGMDIALCVIDHETLTLQYAGAYNPLILIRNGKLDEIKADKMPVGYSDFYGNQPFTNNSVKLERNDCIYIFSDGYADQFGGDEEKKFSSKRLKTLLLEVSNLPMNEQGEIMTQHHDNWKGKHNQVDDVLLIGIRI